MDTRPPIVPSRLREPPPDIRDELIRFGWILIIAGRLTRASSRYSGEICILPSRCRFLKSSPMRRSWPIAKAGSSISWPAGLRIVWATVDTLRPTLIAGSVLGASRAGSLQDFNGIDTTDNPATGKSGRAVVAVDLTFGSILCVED